MTAQKTYAVGLSLTLAFALAFASLMVLPTTAGAWFGGWDRHEEGGDVDVRNNSSAHVTNNVETKADTGDNESDGGDGDDGARGGDATSRGGDATGGEGGEGGDGGDGGDIFTGNADAISTVKNDVNRNNTTVGCECGDRDGGDVDVRNRNHARVTNNVETKADTGDNESDGGDGDEGARGGDADAGNSHHWWWGYTSGGDATGGDGGDGGDGGEGGEIVSGHAYADSYVENRVNRNVTRVR